MARAGFPSRGLARAWAALLLLCAMPPLGACMGSRDANVSAADGVAGPELQALERRARSGDKQAQLELGIRYEEGDGVPLDPDRAEALFRQAAADRGAIAYRYSPPPRPGVAGTVTPIREGAAERGHPEARRRLARIAARRRGTGPVYPNMVGFVSQSRDALPLLQSAHRELLALGSVFELCRGAVRADEDAESYAIELRHCLADSAGSADPCDLPASDRRLVSALLEAAPTLSVLRGVARRIRCDDAPDTPASARPVAADPANPLALLLVLARQPNSLAASELRASYRNRNNPGDFYLQYLCAYLNETTFVDLSLGEYFACSVFSREDFYGS